MEITNRVNQKELEKSFKVACEDQQFRRLLKTIDVTDDIAMKYTSSLEETVKELNHCSNCPGLIDCQTRFEGHVLYPEKKGKQKLQDKNLAIFIFI